MLRKHGNKVPIVIDSLHAKDLRDFFTFQIFFKNQNFHILLSGIASECQAVGVSDMGANSLQRLYHS